MLSLVVQLPWPSAWHAAQPAAAGPRRLPVDVLRPVRAVRGHHRRAVHLVFSPNQGLANEILRISGSVIPRRRGFADPGTVLYALFFVITWKYFGFHMILYLAGRQSIPPELSEAATIDGAGSWQAFRHVTLPLLGPTIRISIFLSVIGTIQLFDMVWVLTSGGPVHASETMAVTMFQYGFKRFEVGYASAISIVMFVISLVFALFYQRFVMRRDTEGAITVMRDQR